MANRPEMVPFLGSEIEEANRFARIDERVLANEILDFRLRLVVESVIGGAYPRIPSRRREPERFARTATNSPL